MIVLRPKDFQEHAPQYLIRCNVAAGPSASSSPGEAAPAQYSCWPVPTHLQRRHWTAVLAQHAEELSQRQLVLPDSNSSQVLLVLSRFEAPEFIHVFMPGRCPGLSLLSAASSNTHPASNSPVLPAAGRATAGMVWQLPRCSLEFELATDGSVISLDHRGYCLSTQQLLVSQSGEGVAYTLPELHQYLVLQLLQGSKSVSADQSDQLVLMPSGRVAVTRHAPGSTHAGSSIQVQLKPHCFAAVKVSAAQIHCVQEPTCQTLCVTKGHFWAMHSLCTCRHGTRAVCSHA